MDSTAVILIVIVLIVLIVGYFLSSRQREPREGAAPSSAPQTRDKAATSTGTAPVVPAADRTGKGLFEEQEPQPSSRPAPPPPSVQPAPPPIIKPPAAAVPPPGGPIPAPAQQSSDDQLNTDFGSAPKPAIPAEDVRFTVFHPKEMAVDSWYTLLTYAHLDSALAIVQTDAARFKAEMGDAPRQAQSSSPAQLTRGTEITVLPQMDGVEFNPERISFKWIEDMHRAEFRMKAAHPLAGLAGNGTISILVGPLIVASVKIGILFDDADSTAPLKAAAPAQATTSIYQAEKIFISYSHKDTDVATACRAVYKALGYDVLIDVDKLRSGEVWNDALLRLIDNADIFQLFWSQNSAQSNFCRQEWQHALQQESLKGNNFIRPVYWEQPLVPPPDELEPLHFAYVPLPKASTDENVH